MDPSPALQPTGGSPIDLSKDFEFRLEFDIEEDIEGELEHFVRLARNGLAKKARDYFQQTLSTHLSLFPVFAEYAEFLVSEGAYHELLSILLTSQEDSDFSDAEYYLVRLLRALIAAREHPEAGAPELVRAWCFDQLRDSGAQLNETTIQCLEVCLVILAVVRTGHLYLEWIDLILDNLLRSTGGGGIGWPLPGFEGTLAFLVREGRYWEASKIVKLLFERASALTKGEAEKIYKVFCEGIKQADITDENVIVARLSVNNAYLKYQIHHTSAPLRSWSIWEELQDLQRATARDLRQLLRDFRDDGSRHTEEFLDNICKLQLFESDPPAADRDEPLSHASSQADRGNQPIRPRNTFLGPFSKLGSIMGDFSHQNTTKSTRDP